MKANSTTASPSTSVGYVVTRGIFWLSANTVAAKLVSIVGQVILSWLLLPEEFGSIGLAYTVLAFTSLIQQAGLNEILVQRGKHFRRWANPAFWMSLALGVLAAAVTLAAAPIAARIYHDPRVIPLLVVLAFTLPVTALSAVPTARIQQQMQFRYIALTNAWTNTAIMALTIVFAYAGMGAMSVVLPRLLVGVAQAGVLWQKVLPPVRLHPQLRRWRFLVGDSGRMLVASLCYAIVAQGDYITLGLLFSKEIVGLYYWGFNLATQTIVLLTVNIGGVLLPALTRLSADRTQQLNGFLRATRALAVVGMPLSVLQAALADPGIRLLFAPRWYAAIPVVQILSLGMTMTMVGSPGVNFLQSQGRFRTVMVMAIGCAASLVGLVLVGARWGQMLGVACGVGIFHAVYGPVCMYVAVRAGGGSIRDVVRVYLPPMVATLVAVGIGYLLSTLLPEIPLRKWAFIAVTTTITAVIYIPMIRWLAPDGWGELSAQLGRLFRSMRPSRSAPATPL